MDFRITEEQRILLDSIDKVLSELSTVELLHAARDADFTTLFNELAEVGLAGTVVSSEFGGAGLKAIDAALISERLGYYAVPFPYLSSIVVSVALDLYAIDEQKKRYLSQLATGGMKVGIAISEHAGAKENAKVLVQGSQLFGRALFALDFDSDCYLIASSDEGLFVVPRDAKGLTLKRLKTIDVTRRFGEMIFNGVDAEELSVDKSSANRIDKLLAWGRVMLAADSLGACQRMLDDSVAYAKERKQFGRVIGSFQAVKHLCAEMAAKLEPSRSMLWHAACSIDVGDKNYDFESSLCKAHISEVGKFVSKTSTEVHGGIGFTDLLGLHYWFKRIGVSRQLLGSPEYLRRDAAKRQGFI